MSSSGGNGGIGFCGALFLLFLGLRLGKVITWPWYWVAAPLWIPVAAVTGIVAVVIVAGFIYGHWAFDRKDKS